MDNFGAIPNAPDFARYMAKQCSDGTWCVWDYRDGEEYRTQVILPEDACRRVAARLNSLLEWQT